MRLWSFVVGILGLVTCTLGQIINYTPSHGTGVSYRVNIPDDTAVNGSGPIYLQLKGPGDFKWMALGTGDRMLAGNLFIVYAAPGGNITLSTRRAIGPIQPIYDPDIKASLLDGSGVHNGTMTANIRCDNCMKLRNGDSIFGSRSSWIWAMTHGGPLLSSNVSETLYQHDWHGIFSLDLTLAVGGNSSNPFSSSDFTVVDYTSTSNQQQVNDTILHRKRIAHGVMTSVAFVLLFPGFALLLYIYPSRYTVTRIHAPLQLFAVLLALAGLGAGISVSQDLRELAGYHPIIGYFAIGGVVLIQPVLGIMQHRHFRKTKEKSLYGFSHRWLGRIFSSVGIINGGVGFYYAYGKNPDIPPASPISYGGISGGVGIIYVSVIAWRRWRDRVQARKALPPKTLKTMASFKSTKSLAESSMSQDPERLDVVDLSQEKPWQP
ncbi:hypothetical protein P175DRAFT_0461958 [Aspergillus ochraceoroseus IBT 24754]|uniref:Cytochrome b561 domain-containing protein n=3 Tax=Aspergillus subgen. Nidulantes TaxID=2720870 RepID=A0A0F8V5V2_9EURO|nr:uncharacterized protein P175DRAFT_0461958 [Aspergillus ochraceoroseus IBT 24754]KKK18672.1 hypothetical protein AOCH_007188 [Aspergillus ochraceoroseus]KKK27169.1 hypothetical protein ARAM_006983 [Aspergillus rambellii]PTU19311.1 hypothetical protein P175DRAFT_0461958 [Aspergillus ochraceoroseus IBT 24754]